MNSVGDGKNTTTTSDNLVPVSEPDNGVDPDGMSQDGMTPEAGADEQDQACQTCTTRTETAEALWDLSHLSGEGREMMEKVLMEEIDVFAKDEHDIGLG